MSSFSFLLTMGIGLLFLSLLIANNNIADCGNETFSCPDGSIVKPDPLNNCFVPACPNFELERYCSPNILWVESNGSLIRTISRLTGAGFTVYDANVTNCPLVAPHYVSIDCARYAAINWSVRVDCSLVNKSIVYHCPMGVTIIGNQSFINCSNPGFTDYCEPRLKQWAEHNCEVEIIS